MDFVVAGIDDPDKVSTDDRRKRMCSHGAVSPCRWEHNRYASTQLRKLSQGGRGGYNQYTYSTATGSTLSHVTV